jgi:hypothetical protein
MLLNIMQDVYAGSAKDEIERTGQNSRVEDESGCWIFGGFTNAGGVHQTWSCCFCCSNSVTESETTRSYKSCCFAPPFAAGSRESEYDKRTGLYTKYNVIPYICMK